MRASIALRSEATELIRLEAFTEAFARDCGFPDDERARLLVILEELFTNVVAHGYGAASVAVALGWRRGWLTIDFVDDGPPFDSLAHARPDLDAPAEQRPIGGLGIAIVRALIDRGRYRRKGACNHLRLVVLTSGTNAEPRSVGPPPADDPRQRRGDPSAAHDLRPPHSPQTGRTCQSGTVVSAP
jgi:serine/threonine-protein kinase RsbW